MTQDLMGWKPGLSSKFRPILTSRKLWLLFIGWSKIFFSKMADSKKMSFSKPSILNIFFTKISRIGPWVIRINWCSSHQFILMTQGPILEIFVKKYWELTVLKNSVFLSWPFWYFFSNFFFFASSHEKQSKFIRVARMGGNFDD